MFLIMVSCVMTNLGEKFTVWSNEAASPGDSSPSLLRPMLPVRLEKGRKSVFTAGRLNGEPGLLFGLSSNVPTSIVVA